MAINLLARALTRVIGGPNGTKKPLAQYARTVGLACDIIISVGALLCVFLGKKIGAGELVPLAKAGVVAGAIALPLFAFLADVRANGDPTPESVDNTCNSVVSVLHDVILPSASITIRITLPCLSSAPYSTQH